MTEREKIIDVLNKNFTQDVECTPIYTTAQGKEVALPQELCDIFNDIVTQAVIPYFADALIAAGIGDVKKSELERKAYEVASNQYRIWFEEQKDRAEVAEKALDLCETAYILSLNHRATEGISGQAIASDLGVHKFFIKQAEKELAEENDGKKEV